MIVGIDRPGSFLVNIMIKYSSRLIVGLIAICYITEAKWSSFKKTFNKYLLVKKYQESKNILVWVMMKYNVLK